METPPLELTPLHDAHLAAGGKMVPFAGFSMPVQYAGLKEEHHAVRDHVGMFDVSHMGEFFVSGPDALALVQWVSSNDASALFDGKVQYSCMPNGRGGIVDDLLVYRMAEDRYMLVVNASNRAKDWAWIQSQVDDKGFDVSLEDASDRHALIALQGPEAQRVLGQLSPTRKDGQPWGDLAYYTFTEGTLLGSDVLVSATGYTGAGGVEIYVAPEGVEAIWRALLDAGVPPCGLGARDTLRMEMGFCLYGNDIDDTTSPMAAGLGWVTKFTKNFVDADTLKAHKADGTARRLRGLVMDDRGIPRQGYDVVDASGQVVGTVTSGTMSPSLGHGIGMAYLDRAVSSLGTDLFVQIRNKRVACHVVKFPFLTS